MIQIKPGIWIKFDGCKIVGASERKLTPEQERQAREEAQGQKTQKRTQSSVNQVEEQK